MFTNCTLPVIFWMSGSAALGYWISWLWMQNKLNEQKKLALDLNELLNGLQLEKSKLIKSANELQSENEEHLKIIAEQKQHLNFMNDNYSKIENEIKLLKEIYQ